MEIVDKLIKLKTTGPKRIGERRIIKYQIYDGMLKRLSKEPLELVLTKSKESEGLYHLVNTIEKSNYSAHTKSDLKKYLKMIYKLVNGLDQEDSPKELRSISTSISRKDKVFPKGMITESEIKAMLAVAKTNARDTAAIHLLYEAGLRPHELLGLKRDSVEFVKDGARITVQAGSKTGSRSILVMDCVPSLAKWMAVHPMKAIGAPLFPSENGLRNYKQMCVENLNKIVKNVARLAGIERNVNTYLLRHTAATRLATICTDSQMKAYFGWEQNSDMASTYIHLSGRDVDAPILAAHGKKVDKAELEGKLLPLNCERCGKQSAHDATACQYCMLPFDKDKAKQSDAAMQERLKKMEGELKELKSMMKKEILRDVDKTRRKD